jgi:DNA-binding CsgD family transcriptional regulator
MSKPSAHEGTDECRRCAVLVIEDDSVVLDIVMTGLVARGSQRAESGSPPGSVVLVRPAGPEGDATEVRVTTVGSAPRGAAAMAVRNQAEAERLLRALSPRQVDVLRLVALGKTNTEIAEIRGTTVSAVGRTITHALAALGIDARRQASGDSPGRP